MLFERWERLNTLPLTKRSAKKQSTQPLLLEAIALGLSIRRACDLAKCSRESFYEWLKTDEEFAEGVQQARIEQEAYCLRNIRAAAPTSWQAAAWLLERTMPKKYAKKQPDVVVAQVQGPALPADPGERRAVLRAILERDESKAA